MYRPSVFHDHFADNLFDEFFNDNFWPAQRQTRPAARTMTTDIKETEDAYLLEVELPGFAKEEVKAELKDGTLTIEATHSESNDEKDEKTGRYLRRERYTGSCRRSFYVGDVVTQEDIKAKFTDGILTVTVPKMEKKPQVEEKKYISIEG